MKRTIVYLNQDCYTDTDLTVLKHLTKDFHVVWFYIHESIKTSNKITIEQAVEYAKKYDIDIHVKDPRMRYRNPKNLLFYFRIAKEINKIVPDVVFHCLRDPYWSLAVKFVLQCENVVLGIHDAQTHSYKMTLSRILEKYSKGLSIKVHRQFVTFSSNQQKLFKHIYGKESSMVGMSCKDFGKSCMHVPSITHGIKLLFFGTINEYKGLDLLISAMEQLRSQGVSNLVLTIAGRGSSWSACKLLIKTQKMYNLQVRFIDNNEIPDLMSSHHFLVLPYRDATQSGPLATAVAYELPVIAPNFGCFSETYTTESAMLYSQGNLVEALKRVAVITNEEYQNMKIACKKVKEANSEERIAENYIHCFNGLMNMESSNFC